MNKHSFAVDFETEPDGKLVKDSFEQKLFVDKPFKSTAKTATTIERHKKTWEDERPLRVQAHEDKENERYDKAFSEAGLRADMASILCMSITYINGSKVSWGDEYIASSIATEIGREVLLLDEFWARVKDAQQSGGKIFSASGSQFDVLFAWRRSIALGVPMDGFMVFEPRSIAYGRPHLHRSFVDLCAVWIAGEYGKYISVNSLAHVFGVEGKHEGEGVTGANFWRDAREDRDKAERYALRDSQIVWEIALKMEKSNVWIDSPPRSVLHDESKELESKASA